MTASVSLLSPIQDAAYEILAGGLPLFPPLDVQLGDLVTERLCEGLIDIERRWGVEIDVDEAYACRTLGRLLTLVEAKVAPETRTPATLPGRPQVADLLAYRAQRGLGPIRAERFLAP